MFRGLFSVVAALLMKMRANDKAKLARNFLAGEQNKLRALLIHLSSVSEQ